MDHVWKVSYSTCKDLDHGRLKSYDGSLQLISPVNWLILKNAKNDPLAVIQLKPSHGFTPGSKIQFSHHVVRVGKCLSEDGSVPHDNTSIAVAIPDWANDVSQPPSPRVLTPEPEVLIIEASNSMVQEAIESGLDFSPGMQMAKEVQKLFHSTVHPSSRSGHFKMIMAFGRSSFRLTKDSATLVLEAVTGGFCGYLNVALVRERVFSFTVATQSIGFYILHKRLYRCEKFKCFFHLWSDGGPNWRRELSSGKMNVSKNGL
jgi:hypothetical protein